MVNLTGRGLVVKQPGAIIQDDIGPEFLSRTGYFLRMAESVGVGAFSPLPKGVWRVKAWGGWYGL